MNNKNTLQKTSNQSSEQKTNEDKFTWEADDIKTYTSVDEIPGFQPFVKDAAAHKKDKKEK